MLITLALILMVTTALCIISRGLVGLLTLLISKLKLSVVLVVGAILGFKRMSQMGKREIIQMKMGKIKSSKKQTFVLTITALILTETIVQFTTLKGLVVSQTPSISQPVWNAVLAAEEVLFLKLNPTTIPLKSLIQVTA